MSSKFGSRILNWHSSCLQCSVCHCRLGHLPMFYHNGGSDMICGHCLDCQESNDCDQCGKMISRYCDLQGKQWSTRDRLRHFHNQCYKCYKCQRSFGGGGGDDYQNVNVLKCLEIFSLGQQQQQKQQQQQQQQQQNQEEMTKKSQLLCQQCLDENTAKLCQFCRKKILRFSENEVPIVNSGVAGGVQQWHRKCFRCSKCRRSLFNGFYTFKDGGNYCKQCYTAIDPAFSNDDQTHGSNLLALST